MTILCDVCVWCCSVNTETTAEAEGVSCPSADAAPETGVQLRDTNTAHFVTFSAVFTVCLIAVEAAVAPESGAAPSAVKPDVVSEALSSMPATESPASPPTPPKKLEVNKKRASNDASDEEVERPAKVIVA